MLEARVGIEPRLQFQMNARENRAQKLEHEGHHASDKLPRFVAG
jgi:hypothetical protein